MKERQIKPTELLETAEVEMYLCKSGAWQKKVINYPTATDLS